MRIFWIGLLVSALAWAQEKGRTRQRNRSQEKKESPAPTTQAVTIRGRVVGEDGEPLAGAYIRVRGTVQGSVAGVDGSFQITLLSPKEPMELEVSYVGYEPQVISASLEEGQQGITITLRETGVQTQEVVISASRVPEAVMQSPVTVLKMSAREILEAPGVSLLLCHEYAFCTAAGWDRNAGTDIEFSCWDDHECGRFGCSVGRVYFGTGLSSVWSKCPQWDFERLY